MTLKKLRLDMNVVSLLKNSMTLKKATFLKRSRWLKLKENNKYKSSEESIKIDSSLLFLVKNEMIFLYNFQFCSCMLAYVMVRSYSLSHILFPRASAFYKIVN